MFNPQSLSFYYHNPKAWMNMIIFKDWLQKFDKQMRNQKRNILLLVDNAARHNTKSDIALTNIKLEYLPPVYSNL